MLLKALTLASSSLLLLIFGGCASQPIPLNYAPSSVLTLEGKVAVVTGGTSGMGLGTVERFLADGASVVVADLNTGRGDELIEACGQRGEQDRVRFTRTDVSVGPKNCCSMVGRSAAGMFPVRLLEYSI